MRYRFVEIENDKGYIVPFSVEGVIFDRKVAEAVIEELNSVASQTYREFANARDVRSREAIDYGF
jgi:hypothetical protein